MFTICFKKQFSRACLATVVGLFCGGLLIAQKAYPYDVLDALRETLINHPDILSAKANEEAAAHDVRDAFGGYLPEFNVFAGIGKEYSDNPATRGTRQNTFTLTRQESEMALSQLLFDGGFVRNQVSRSRHLLRRSGYQVEEDQERLGFDSISAYLNVQRTRELEQIDILDVKIHEETLIKVQKRLQAGAGRRSEISLVESRLALSNAQLEQTRGNVHDARDTFTKVVGSLPPKEMAAVTLPSTIPQTLIEAQQIAIDGSPSIASFAADYDASKSEIALAKSTYYPKITFDFESSYSNDLDGVKGYNNDALAMVRMRYNVYRGGSDKAAVHAAVDRNAAARFELENVVRDIKEDVALAWNSYRATQRRIPYLRAHVKESLDVFDAYQKQFQLGQRTLFDLLNALVEHYDARRDLINGLYDEKTAVYRLLSAMGKLVDTVTKQSDQRELSTVRQIKSFADKPLSQLPNKIHTPIVSKETETKLSKASQEVIQRQQKAERVIANEAEQQRVNREIAATETVLSKSADKIDPKAKSLNKEMFSSSMAMRAKIESMAMSKTVTLPQPEFTEYQKPNRAALKELAKLTDEQEKQAALQVKEQEVVALAAAKEAKLVHLAEAKEAKRAEKMLSRQKKQAQHLEQKQALARNEELRAFRVQQLAQLQEDEKQHLAMQREQKLAVQEHKELKSASNGKKGGVSHFLQRSQEKPKAELEQGGEQLSMVVLPTPVFADHREKA